MHDRPTVAPPGRRRRRSALRPRARVLVVERAEARAMLVDALGECELDARETHGDVDRVMRHGDHAAWLLGTAIEPSAALELLAAARAAGKTTPALVTARAVSGALVNRAQFLGAEILLEPYALDNVRSFVARALAKRSAPPGTAVTRLAAASGLSPRETDVVNVLLAGVPRAAIALELGLSENTVKTTVRHVLQKTRCPNVEQLRCLLLRTG